MSGRGNGRDPSQPVPTANEAGGIVLVSLIVLKCVYFIATLTKGFFAIFDTKNFKFV